jgi:hypothetical protein
MRSNCGRATDKPITKHTLRRQDNLEYFLYYKLRRCVCMITGAILHYPQTELTVLTSPPNGVRYPLVGGTRQRHFSGIHSKPRKVLENAPTPTSRVHAVLARFLYGDVFAIIRPFSANLFNVMSNIPSFMPRMHIFI